MNPTLLTGVICLAIGSYLYGSICWAIIIGRMKLHQDIRLLGDGNPGAHNTSQNLGSKLGILVMLLDSTKGFIPAIIASTVNFKEYQGWAIGVVGTCSILGHCFPIFFEFKGGNGISTLFGFMIVFQSWMVLEWGIFVFVLTLIFKYIKPIQLISTTLTGALGFIIKWDFYWKNYFPMLTSSITMVVIPLMVLFVSLIQLPRFIPHFYRAFKRTDEKTYLLAPLFKHKNSSVDNE
ncbi:MAG: glycerol-3-phosphate acyltransferase [Candidatus Heimdallarchaeota archaeon]|nr:glycerol-3-phosphate acyltransferase [Candidatus Heimdallarchaeota archaeon]